MSVETADTVRMKSYLRCARRNAEKGRSPYRHLVSACTLAGWEAGMEDNPPNGFLEEVGEIENIYRAKRMEAIQSAKTRIINLDDPKYRGLVTRNATV